MSNYPERREEMGSYVREKQTVQEKESLVHEYSRVHGELCSKVERESRAERGGGGSFTRRHGTPPGKGPLSWSPAVHRIWSLQRPVILTHVANG